MLYFLILFKKYTHGGGRGGECSQAPEMSSYKDNAFSTISWLYSSLNSTLFQYYKKIYLKFEYFSKFG